MEFQFCCCRYNWIFFSTFVRITFAYLNTTWDLRVISMVQIVCSCTRNLGYISIVNTIQDIPFWKWRLLSYVSPRTSLISKATTHHHFKFYISICLFIPYCSSSLTGFFLLLFSPPLSSVVSIFLFYL